MAERPLNLAPQRGPSVWDRPSPTRGWSLDESERLCAGLCGGTLAILGALMARRRGLGGALLAAAGGTLVVRALLGHHDLTNLRVLVERIGGARAGDAVDSASDDSFPASDAPSWTPTAGAKAP